MLEVNNICRICLREEDPKLPIFTENGEKTDSKPSLPEKIMSFAQVKVSRNDGLPSSICVKCYCQVDETFEFIKLCEESFQFVTRQLERYVRHKEQESLQNELVSKTTSGKESNSNINEDSSNLKQAETPEKSSPIESSATIRTTTTTADATEKNGEADNQSTLQIASTAGNVKAWSEEPPERMFVDTSIVKPEPHWTYDSNDDRLDNYDSNEENVSYDNYIDSSGAKFQNETSFDDESLSGALVLSPTSGKEAYKCKNCSLIFYDRKSMGHHISTTHRRCGDCGKYFFSNKHKDSHNCLKPQTPTSNFQKTQFCKICKMNVRHMKQHRTSTKHKDAIADIRKNVMLKSLEERRKSKELKNADQSSSIANTSAADSSTNNESVDGEKVTCHICDLVCVNQRGFKTHMTTIHRNYRIIYYCQSCPDRMFQSRPLIEKHMIQKHGGVPAGGNIPYEFKTRAEIEKFEQQDSSSEQESSKKRRGVPVNKFECMYCGMKYLTFTDCQKHLHQAHKSTNAQRIRILREYADEKISSKVPESSTPKPKVSNPQPISKTNGNPPGIQKPPPSVPRKPQHPVVIQKPQHPVTFQNQTHPEVLDDEEDEEGEEQIDVERDSEDENTNSRRPRRTLSATKKPSPPSSPSSIAKRKYIKTHPAFNSKMPVVANNFSIVLDDFGVKEYRCNGCNSTYNRYISAYNHYYTLSKKFPIIEKKQLPESKPFGCKICTLKFSSRAQAMSHRLNAHKLFYSQLKAARRNKLLAAAETERDYQVIESRLRKF